MIALPLTPLSASLLLKKGKSKVGCGGLVVSRQSKR